jgi:hypothetical protein
MFSVLILGRVAYDDSKKQYLQLALSSLSYWEVCSIFDRGDYYTSSVIIVK